VEVLVQRNAELEATKRSGPPQFNAVEGEGVRPGRDMPSRLYAHHAAACRRKL